MSKVKYNPKVIEYDRFQPEFYEDTKTYISKRSSDKKVKIAIKIYNSEKSLIDQVEKNIIKFMLVLVEMYLHVVGWTWNGCHLHNLQEWII